MIFLLTNVSLFTFGIMVSLQNPNKAKNGKISRRDEILKKAIHMYRERGYASSSVRDLAQKVGIEAPSIYSHFKSKEQILQQICFEMADTFMKGIERTENVKHVQERLSLAIKEHIEVVINQREASVVMWNEWKFMTNPSLGVFQMMIRDYEERFEMIIKEGMKKGAFRKLDPKTVTNLILASLNSMGHWHKYNDRSSSDLEHEFSEIYLRGILN